MSKTYHLPGFPPNPPWIKEELCRDPSHDDVPQEAQPLVRRGCCLPQKRVTRYINGAMKYRLEHRPGVPQHKVDEVNTVGLNYWKLSKEDAAKQQFVMKKVEFAEQEDEAVAEKKVAKQVNNNEELTKEKIVAEELAEENITTQEEIATKEAIEEDSATGENWGEEVAKPITEDETNFKNIAVTDETTQSAEKVYAHQKYPRYPQANTFQAIDETTSVCEEDDEQGGVNETMAVVRDDDLDDGFEVVEGGGPAEEMRQTSFLSKALRAIRLI